MLRNNQLTPINIFGLIIFAIGIIGSILEMLYFDDPEISIGFKTFGVIISLWHLVTGVGVLIRSKFGLYAFKSYLYVLYLGFPVGTYISAKILNYIKTNKWN